MRPYSHFLDQLRGAGLRPTRQRLALAKLLFESGDRHVTAEMLHAEALGKNVRVSLATVYNTLHQFTKAGLLSEIVVDTSRFYFDTNTSKHHHLYYEDSGELEDVDAAEITVSGPIVAPDGMQVKSVNVVVRIGK